MRWLERFHPTRIKTRKTLEGSFDDALDVFLRGLPTTCPHIGDRDFSCGRSSVSIPESVLGILGLNGNGSEKAEVFVAAHQSNSEVERRALILVQIGAKSAVFRVEGRSVIEVLPKKDDWEETSEKVVTNYRDVYLEIPDGDGVQRLKVEPGSLEHSAFRDILPLAKAISEKPEGLLCNGCAAKKYGLPRTVVR